ncbi:MAG TPA: hypothetical protein VF399_09985 [bacterium]
MPNDVEKKQKSKRTSKRVIIFVFIGLGLLVLICTYPEYISMQQRGWSQEKLPMIFSDVSKKYTRDNQGIILTDHYISELAHQFYELKYRYGFDDAKKIFIPIVDSILKEEIHADNDKIDIPLIFSKIDSAVSNTKIIIKKQ